MKRSIWVILLGWAVFAGCSSTLETGYEPRKLGASASERRSYYAEPFSPEASVPKEQRNDGPPTQSQRPGRY